MSTVDKDNQPEQTQHSPSDVFVDDKAAAIEERVDQVEQVEKQPLMYTFNTQTASEHTTSSKPPAHPNQGAAHRKEEEPVAIVKKDPGWYKQMFQQFQNTVEEHFPGGTHVCCCILRALLGQQIAVYTYNVMYICMHIQC